MLQINTGKYFAQPHEVHETLQRHVLHTNTWTLDPAAVRMGDAELAWSTGHDGLRTVTVTITEKLERFRPDGTESIMIAVGGREIVQDIGDILSFFLDATFDLDSDLVDRLTSEEARGPRTLLAQPFSKARLVTADELEAAEEFLCGLLDLNRQSYESAIRAIRCVVRAARTARADPTLAYTLYVAALESLAQTAEAPSVPWERLDHRKRRLFDEALVGLPAADADRIRAAVLEAERAGLSARFQAFALDHVTGEYYRDTTAGSLPARASDLPGALKEAYRVRSGNVHTLTELPREAWAATGGFDTVQPPESKRLLSIEGVHRLSRHVIRNWAERASTVETEPFSFWDALPNILRMEVAAEYWVWQAAGLTHETAGRYLNGTLDIWLSVLGRYKDTWVDLGDVLARIEQLAAGTSAKQRTLLVALYAIWHGNLHPDHHRPNAEAFLAKHAGLLAAPSMVSFVVDLTTGQLAWPLEDYERLAAERRTQRGRTQDWQVPAAFDAALLAVLADQLEQAGRHEEALTIIDEAIGELPANAELLRVEQQLIRNQPLDLDLEQVLAPHPAVEAPDVEQRSAITNDSSPGDPESVHEEATDQRPPVTTGYAPPTVPP